jgi:O-acetyl-ADP-ribose deacetylase (regulator of RNase III)
MSEANINIVEKNILFADEPIVGHCCNTRNTMNSGVAKALRERFPEIYDGDTSAYILHGKNLLGKCIMVDVTTRPEDTSIRHLANLYGQPNYGYNGNRYLDYEAMYQSLEELKNYLRPTKYNQLALPYNIGCNRAGGHWPIVLEIIKHIFDNTGITVNLYKI